MAPGEQRAHFALWSLLKSPLLISADLRTISPTALNILKAREVVAVNQDDLGVAGDLIWKEGPLEACLPLCLLCLPYGRSLDAASITLAVGWGARVEAVASLFIV